MQNTEDRKWLYEQLKDNGYDIGSQEEFESSLDNNEEDAKWYHEQATSLGLEVGNYEDFGSLFRNKPQGYTLDEMKAAPMTEQYSVTPKPSKSQEKFGLDSGIPSIAETAKGMIEGHRVTPTFSIENQPQEITAFGEGVKQGKEQLVAGAQYGIGEAAASVLGTSRDDIEALAEIERLQAEGKDVAEETKNVTDLSAVSPIVKKGLELMGAGKAIGEAEKITQRNRTIQKALKENEGDVDKAKKWLESRAGKQTWADEMMADATYKMAQAKPTKGWGWVGSMIPQMVGTGVGLAASMVFKSPLPAQILGGANMAGLIASTAGQAMAEARQAGASNSQVWASGIANGAVELLTEKIPYNRYVGRITDAAKNSAKQALGKAVTEVGSPANKELKDLLSKANKRLGGKLFSGKNIEDYMGDLMAEGLSEATAEGLQTILPILYENPENYPTFMEILGNSLEGAKGGVFMGMFLGGASKAAEHRMNRARRKAQGYVDVAEVTTPDGKDEIVEVVRNEQDQPVFLWNGEQIPISENNVKQRQQFNFDDFERGQFQLEEDEAYENGKTLETPAEMTDANNMYEIAAIELANRSFGLQDQEIDSKSKEDVEGIVNQIELMYGGNPLQAAHDIRDTDSETSDLILNYAYAKATRDGIIDAARDRISEESAQAEAIIDYRKNKDDGMIHPATLEAKDANGNDKQVYVVSGNIVTFEDGTINTQESSKDFIIIQDAVTGKPEFTTAKDLLRAEQALDPEVEKQNVRNTIADTIATEVENKMNNVLPFNVGDAYNVIGADGAEHSVQVMADNGDGSVMASIDNAEAVAMPKSEIQQLSNEYNMNRARLANEAQKEAKQSEKMMQESQNVEPTNVVEQTTETPAEVVPERVVPTLKDGNPDFNAMDAEMFVDEYVSRYGEDSAVKIARKNISNARENIAKIDKKIDDITDPNQMEGLYVQRKSAEAQIARYSEILDRLGASEDANESEADQRNRLRNDAGNRITALFPDGMPNVESFILADIATGNRIRWSDKVTNGVVTSRGLGAELGLSDSKQERTRRLPLIGKDAMTPEEYAESLRERLDAVGIRYDESSLRDAVLDVYQSVDSRKGAWDALENIAKRGAEQEVDTDWESMQQERAYNKAQEVAENTPELPSLDTIEEETPITEGEYAEMEAQAQAEEQKDYDAMMAENQPINEAGATPVITLSDEKIEFQNKIQEWLSPENVSWAEGKDLSDSIEKFGNEVEPIAILPEIVRGLFPEVSSLYLYSGKGYLIDHAANHHPELSADEYNKIQEVLDSYDDIKDVSTPKTKKIAFVKMLDKGFAVVAELAEKDGKIMLHKTFFYKDAQGKRVPYKNKPSLLKESSVDGSTTISPAESAAGRHRNISALDASSESKDTTSEPQKQEVDEKISQEEAKVNTNPTDGQKEAGNYKKGHVVVDGFNITIEQPKGSVRSGVDADGKEWSITMNNTYGYIRGTEGVDGDHIDVFLSDNLDNWGGEVFVVDQINTDGSFDEHKVMYGFNSIEEAQQAYLSNYSEGWQGLGAITGISKDEFKKWIASSHRKTKPFAEYKSVNKTEGQAVNTTDSASLAERTTPTLIKGAKWDSTGEPTKMKYSRKGDNFDGYITVGKKKYGRTTSEGEEFDILLEDYGSLENAWNAYERGDVFISPNLASIIKTILIEKGDSTNQSKDNADDEQILFRGGEKSVQEEVTETIFATAKDKFGTTYDMREAGYILPDGSMLDFSGKHEIRGADTSFLNGQRSVDHRAIQEIAYDFDENKTGVETDMGDFLDRGAIRIDYNTGAINLNVAPTKAQKDRLKRLIERNDGDVYIDFGKGWDTEHYVEYESARASRVLGDIDRYFNEGIKPSGNIRFRSAESAQIAPVFYSNAEYAVKAVKQEKATPEQWLKMIEKNGGLKAGEDKWLGLSDWLKASDKKTLTKQEVLDFIKENQIQIEEVVYGSLEELPRFKELRNEYKSLLVENDYNNERTFKAMVDKYGEDFELAFEGWGNDLHINSYYGTEAADAFLDARDINDTRIQYTTDGLDNKREIALTVPTIESWNESDEIHFGDAGNGRAIAWVRFGETTDADGNRVLVIDEVQSKRHQEGREKGYNNPRIIEILNRLGAIESYMYSPQGMSGKMFSEREALKAELESLFEADNPVMKATAEQLDEKKSKRAALLKEKSEMEDDERVEILKLQNKQDEVRNVRDYDYYESEINEIQKRIDQRNEELGLLASDITALNNEYSRYYNTELRNARIGVSPAPFEKNWAELAMKRMLRYAAENGFDKIAWTTGEQQAERYDISKSVDNIKSEDNNVEETSDGTIIVKNITIYAGGSVHNLFVDANGIVRGREYDGKKLSDIVGKPLAEKLMEKGDFELEGDGLRIGGEGMKAFYDQMIPSFMNKYGKKWGVKVGEVTMPSLEENNTMHSIDVTDAMRESVMQGQPMFRITKSNFDSQLADLQSEYDALDKNDTEALNAWRDKKADVVRSYVNWVSDKFGLKCELYVFNGGREEEMRKAYDTMVEKYKAEGIEKVPSYESFKKKVSNPKVVATHRKSINFVTFNTSAKDAELDIEQFAETLFHENAHRIAEKMYSKQELEQIWENAKKSKNHIAKSVEKLYSDKSDAQKGNEFIAKAIGELVRNHKQLFTKFLMGKDDISAEDLVKKLKYSLPLGKLALTETLNKFKDEYQERVLQGTGSSLLGGSRDGGNIEVSEGDGGRNSRRNRQRESGRLRAERGRDVVETATNLASSLGVKLNVIEDVNEITDSNARRQRAKRGAKAWYDVNTDQVYFVASNATSIADAQESVLHEVVAHKGLRDVVGRENFDRFLDKVFQSATPEIRSQIVRLAAQNGWDSSTATEEYLASLAEEGFDSRENRTFWEKVRDLFMDMLRETKIALGYNITDNDMRYMLWRTYQKQKSQGAMAVAEDVLMQQKLGVGNFRTRPAGTFDANNDDIRFRTAPKSADIEDGEVKQIRKKYDKKVNTGRKGTLRMTKYNFIEANQDEMRSLKEYQKLVKEAYGIDKLPSHLDVYALENRIGSAGFEKFNRFVDSEYEVMQQFIDDYIAMGGETLESVIDYARAKSGLERNREFTVRDYIDKEAKAKLITKKEAEKMLEQVNTELQNDIITPTQADARRQQINNMLNTNKNTEEQITAMREQYKAQRDAYRKMLEDDLISYADFNRMSDEYVKKFTGLDVADYSGLSATAERMGKKANEWKKVAADTVEAFENKHDNTKEFWSSVKACNDAVIKEVYDSGMISKQLYDHLKEQLLWYIPMSGFTEDTAEDVYSYIGGETGAFTPPVKKAVGRLSESDDPFAIIANKMQGAILQGNRNRIKLAFLNLVQIYPTDLVTEGKVWLTKQADGTWEMDMLEIPADTSSDDAAQLIEEYNQKMCSLKKQGLAREYKNKLNVPYVIQTRSHQNDHEIIAYRNGQQYVMYVNGNPQLAKAINGKLKDKGINFFYKLLDKWNRIESANKTSWNPDFIAPNVMRDFEDAILSTFIDAGVKDAAKLAKTFVAVFPEVVRSISGSENKSGKYAKYFEEFMQNGGETGYSHLHDVEKWKDINQRRWKRLGLGGKALNIPVQAFNGIGSMFSYLNRIAEDSTRFAAYVHSRQKGKTIGESIKAAKDITTNFNKKGSGATEGIWGFLANFMRRWFLFYNPMVQGIYKHWERMTQSKKRYALVFAAMAGAGYLAAVLNKAATDDDDEEKKYFNQSDYTRRTNIMIYTGDGYIKIPLPPVFREMYALGDIMYSIQCGVITPWEGTKEVVNLVRGLFNLEGQSSLKDKEFSWFRFVIPQSTEFMADIEDNVTFTGTPLYKDTPWNKFDPEYQKVYNGTWTPLIRLSKAINDILPHEDYLHEVDDQMAGKGSSKWINPAVWQHIIEDVTGGVGKTIGDAITIVDNIKNDTETDLYNIPIAKRFYAKPDERTRGRILKNQYYDAIEELDRMNNKYKKYTDYLKANLDPIEIAAKTLEYWDSDEGKLHKLIKDSKSKIDKLNRQLKEAKDDASAEEIALQQEQEMNNLIESLKAMESSNK